MKKVLSYILIFVVIFTNLFAPFSVGIKDLKINLSKKEVRAEYNYSLEITPTTTDKDISLKIKVIDGSSVSDGTGVGVVTMSANLQVKATVFKDGVEVDSDTAYLGTQTKETTISLNGKIFSSLDPDTAYTTKVELIERLTTQTTAGTAPSGTFDLKTLYSTTVNTPTLKTGAQAVTQDTINVNGTSSTLKVEDTPPQEKMPACVFSSPIAGTFMGCIAQMFYYVLFVPTSYLFALAGVFFDNTFAYSVQDTSYRSTFVVEGWGLVRDFCNMFFIFILLYTAIATVLSLHNFNTKQTIIRVVVIGLFINFSLFATQVIIDASNVTARVFYNADTIKVTVKGTTKLTGGTATVPVVGGTVSGQTESDTGVISLSSALVDKIDPQNLIINSEKINKVPVKGGDSMVSDDTKPNMGAGTFILIVIIASAVNIVGFIVFLTVGMLFIARVIGLWVAMIISPLAFFTYILPSMEGIKMVGWRNWWSDTIKLAFLAPVFIFFMYIILRFLSLDLIADANSKDGLTFFIATLMPFAFIMILLMKAKKIATDMSGEFGEFAVKAGTAVGGLALGAATGGAAMAMRGTLGKVGNNISNSSWLAKQEAKGGPGGYLAKMALKSGDKLGSASFDARNTKVGGTAAGALGVNLGKGKTGGFKKAEADKTASRTNRAEELKHIVEKEYVVKKRKADVQKKLIENGAFADIERLDKELEAQRQNHKDTSDPEKKAKIETEIARIKNEKNMIELGGTISKDHHGNIEKNQDGTNKYNTDNGHISEKGLEAIEKQEGEAKESFDKSQLKLAEANDEKNKEIESFKTESEKIEEDLKNTLTSIDEEEKTTIDKMRDEILSKKVVGFGGKRELNKQDEEQIQQKAQEFEQRRTTAKISTESLKTTAKTNHEKKITEINNKVSKAEEETNKAKDVFSKKKEVADTARKDAEKGFGKSIKEYKDAATKAEHEMHEKANKVANDYANWIASDWNKAANIFNSASTEKGTDEAVDSIRLGIKTKSVDSHGGGDHGAGGHAAPATTKAHVPEKKADDHGAKGGGDPHAHGH